MNTAFKGTINEQKVILNLLSREYEIYKSINGGAHCDLVGISPNGMVLRIEVTVGQRLKSGKIVTPKKDPVNYDVLAIVIGDLIVYQPLIDTL